MALAPVVVLLAWAHFVRTSYSDADILALLTAGLVGLVGVMTLPLSKNVRVIVALIYVVVGVLALPFVTLLAVCSTGDCL